MGGGFLYTNRDSVSIGLVATLSDLCTSTVALPDLLERFKQHPAVEPVLRGGKLVEYSGHMVPEGGLAMVPELTGDGCLVAGDAAIFDTYPAMASDMMQSLFKVDGAPVRPLRKKMMEPLRRVGLMTVLGDVRKGMKAL